MVIEAESGDVVHRARESMGNRYIASFNGKLRDELLNREIFYTLPETIVFPGMGLPNPCSSLKTPGGFLQ